MHDIQNQLVSLKRTVTDQNVRIEELNNRMYLMEDKLASRDHDPMGETPQDLRRIKLVPEGEGKRKSPKQLTFPEKRGSDSDRAARKPIVFSNWDRKKRSSSKISKRANNEGRSSVKTAYERALDLYRAKRYEQAIAAFSAILDQYEANTYTDNAVYWIGVSRFELGEYGLAIEQFKRVDAMKSSNKKADALYHLSLCYEKLGDEAGVKAARQKLGERYPDSEAARKIGKAK